MAGTWTALHTQPNFKASTMLLLTDGTVMCHELDTKHWHKLTPDGSGSTSPAQAYINGSWSSLADFNDDSNLTATQGGPTYAPRFFASAVLADGTVFVCGGEYNNLAVTNKPNDVNTVELYDPVANRWTNLRAPSGWSRLGDAPTCVLPDGRVLVGNSFLNTNPVAIFDPVTREWQTAANKGDSSSEEGFTLLPDETVLTVQCSNIPNSEKYIIASDQWVKAGNTQVTLPQSCPGIVPEIGPAILLPDGRVFQVGATGATALYAPPPRPTDLGKWDVGPTLNARIGSINQTMFPIDAPAALLPNGKVLCVGSPSPPCKFPAPSNFFEFDPSDNTATAITANTGSGTQTPRNANVPCYMTRLLLLPTGQVLFSTGSKSIYVYTPNGSPEAAWKPTISSFDSDMALGHSYTISGTQLNGLSQACTYGDDTQMATNYPLVQINHASTKNRVFLRTSGHSTMGVATGASTQTTYVTIPPDLPTGQYELVVIANGIASDPVTVVIQPMGRIIMAAVSLTADLTGDGRADIVGFGEAGVMVALNNGDGTFAPPANVLREFGADPSVGGWRVDRDPRFVAGIGSIGG